MRIKTRSGRILLKGSNVKKVLWRVRQIIPKKRGKTMRLIFSFQPLLVRCSSFPSFLSLLEMMEERIR
jgi:hypothetical protein